MLERKTLPDMADILGELGVWLPTDVKFADRVNQIRNGIAHKNTQLIAKLVNSGKPVTNFTLHEVMSSVDMCDFLVKTISLHDRR